LVTEEKGQLLSQFSVPKGKEGRKRRGKEDFPWGVEKRGKKLGKSAQKNLKL